MEDKERSRVRLSDLWFNALSLSYVIKEPFFFFFMRSYVTFHAWCPDWRQSVDGLVPCWPRARNDGKNQCC